MIRRRADRGSGGGAFTLVELLVVVGIIALLITILMPALSAVKELTRRTLCRVHQRNLLVSLAVYAKDHNEKLPPYKQTGENTYFAAYSTRNIFDGRIRDPRTNLLLPLNLAMVWEHGCVSEAAFFYCPSQKHPYYQLNSYPQPWGKENHLPSGYHRTGYMYNPHVVKQRRAYETTDEFPTHKAMVLDILHMPDAVAHWTTDGVPGWNVGFGDGSVDFRASQKVYDIAVKYCPLANSWARYDIARNELEGCEGP